jgi:CRP/FNR family cyclic AMP-dependent transcriptional regulator
MATLYLLEESAIFALMNRDGWPVLVYPGSIRTFQDIAEGRFPGVPEHLGSLVFVSLRLNRTGLFYDDRADKQIRRLAVCGNGQALKAAWTEDWWEVVTSKRYKYTSRRVFRQRETLLEFGQADDGAVYFLLEGGVEIALPSPGGDIKQQLATLEAGSVFGEQAFLDGLPRTASVIARTDGRACQLSREGFERLRADQPQLACSLLAYLGRVQSVRKRPYTEEARALIA